MERAIGSWRGPEGTHTFTVAALWTQSLDPSMPRVVGRSSTSTEITIKP